MDEEVAHPASGCGVVKVPTAVGEPDFDHHCTFSRDSKRRASGSGIGEDFEPEAAVAANEVEEVGHREREWSSESKWGNQDAGSWMHSLPLLEDSR